MRKNFYKLLTDLYKKDKRVAILLGDIGVFSFNGLFKSEDKDRIYNLGILEQTMIGVSSGLSSAGFIPFVHSIAPFVTERCFEQLKLNLGYENKNVFVVSVGNSYDYAALGVTHHCPNDLKIMSSIPNFKVFCPGNSYEVKRIIEENISCESPKYIRLSETENNLDKIKSSYEDLEILKIDKNGICIVVGTGVKDFNKLLGSNPKTSILYTNKISDFDIGKLSRIIEENGIKTNITVIEPSYESGIVYKIAVSIKNIEALNSISIKNEFINKYGLKSQIDEYLQLDDESIINRIHKIYEN